jgi:PTH1 family peptidyl-tRNA hydrolase
MILIVGLGNPGREYEGTRHNAGFMVVDRLASELNMTFTKEKKHDSLIARSDIKDVILMKPQTFMNQSGQAVEAAKSFYKIKTDQVWVVYDDVDLPAGTARVRGKGSGRGSHRGVQSITAVLGAAEFPRFRIGIARASHNISAAERPQKPVDLKDFVLSPFDKREQPLVEKAMRWAVKEILLALKTGRVVSKTLTKGA